MKKNLIKIFSIKKFLFPFIILFVVQFPSKAQSQSDQTTEARKIWLQGFELYEKAEATEKIGNLQEALKLYEESLVYFNKVQKNYPTWNTYLLDFRIKKCLEKINNLNASLRKIKTQPVLQNEKEPYQNKEHTQQKDQEKEKLIARIITLERELKEANNKLQSAYSRIANLEKEAIRGAAAVEELSRTSKEKLELEKRLSLISAELKKALEEKTPEQIDKEKQKLRDELIATKGKLHETEKKLTDLHNLIENYKKEIHSLKLQKTETEFKLNQAEFTSKNLSSKISELEKNNESLRKNLLEQEKQINTLTNEIQKKNNTISELSTKINELNETIKIASAKSDTAPLLEKIQLENKELENKLSLKEQELNKIFTRLNNTENLLKEISIKNEKYERIISDQLNKINNQTDEINALQKKIQQLNSLVTTTSNENNTLLQKNNELNKLIDQLNEKLLSLSKKDADYTNLLKYSADLEAKNKSLTEKINSSEQELSQLKENLKQSLDNQQNLQQLNNSLQQEIQKLNSNINQLNEQLLSVTKNFEEKNNQLSLALSENKKLKSQIEIYKQKLEEGEKLKESLHTLQENASNSAEQLQKTLQELNSLREQLSVANKTIQELSDERKILSEKLKQTELKLNELQNLNTQLMNVKQIAEKFQTELNSFNKFSDEKTNTADIIEQLNITLMQLTSAQNEIKKLKEQNNALRARLEEKITESIYPKSFKEEKEKLLNIIKEKDELITQLQTQLENAKKVSQLDQKHTTNQINETKDISSTNEKVSILLKAAADAEKNNDIESAIWHYQKIFEFHSDNQQALLHLAKIFTAKNEKIKAESYLNKINPDKLDPALTVQYAKLLLSLSPKEFQKAIDLYKKAVNEGGPKDTELETKLLDIEKNQ